MLVLNERDPLHPRAGGAEVHVWEIFRRFAERGHEVTVATCNVPGRPSEEVVDGLRVRRLGPVPLYYVRAVLACARETRRGHYDLVVECLNKLPFYAPVYSRVPVLAVCHHLFGEAAFLQVSWLVAAAVWLAERPIPRLYRRAIFVAISESSRDDLVARGVAPETTHVVPCGIRRPEVDEIRPPSQREDLVSYVGRLEPYKRVDVLLRAMAALRERFPAARTLVIGRGTAQDGLVRLARELGMADAVEFAGFVSDEERDAALAASRVCVCPSVKEGWGLTVIEANAVETPVVATDAPGLRESVRDGETGFLVAEGDVDAFAERIGALLEDDALADRMGRAGEAWARNFDWDGVADEVEDIARSLLATHTAGPSAAAVPGREAR